MSQTTVIRDIIAKTTTEDRKQLIKFINIVSALSSLDKTEFNAAVDVVLKGFNSDIFNLTSLKKFIVDGDEHAQRCAILLDLFNTPIDMTFHEMLSSKKLMTIDDMLLLSDKKIELPAGSTVFARRQYPDNNGSNVAQSFNKMLKDYNLETYNFLDTIIAGGCFTPYGSPYADIDLFIVGDPQRAILNFVNHFGTDPKTKFYLSSRTLSVFYNGKKIQLVLKVYDSPVSVLDSFDLGPACIFYNGHGIFMYPECAYSMVTRNMIVNLDRKKNGYSRRLMKYYIDKGFNLVFIDDISKYIYTAARGNTKCRFIYINNHIIYERIDGYEYSTYYTMNYIVKCMSNEACYNIIGFDPNIKNVVTSSDGTEIKCYTNHTIPSIRVYSEFIEGINEEDESFYGFSAINYYHHSQCASIEYKIDMLSGKSFKPSAIYRIMSADQMRRFIASGKKYVRIQITQEEIDECVAKNYYFSRQVLSSTFNTIDLFIGIEKADSEFYAPRKTITKTFDDVFHVLA